VADTDGVIGCDYCRDPAAQLHDGLASDPAWMTLLLECPRCGQYYGYCGVEPHYRPPLTPAEAAECFPDAFRYGRPMQYNAEPLSWPADLNPNENP
jgi:hypothetical protein